MLKIHFSNQTEKLFLDLKEDLFGSSQPFSKRLVIVPSSPMKSWLAFQLANDPDLTIAAGLNICFLEQAVRCLQGWLAKPQKEGCEPTELELAFAIEFAILHLNKEFSFLSSFQQSVWRPLIDYLEIDATISHLPSLKSQKRISALASSLAKIFLDYGKYGSGLWELWKHPLSMDWQKLLWERMEKIFSIWNYPYRKLESFAITDAPSLDLQIYLFGLSYFPPVYHRFFQKLSQQLPVNYYLLSPCQKFWSDILSDKESSKLKNYWSTQGVSSIQLEALEVHLKDNNPLLANFGRMGREMACQLEAQDPLSSERYVLPSSLLSHPSYHDLLSDDMTFDSTQTPLTLLQAIQADLLLLRNPETSEKVLFAQYDKSIQVHAAPKPMREVQVVYDLILSVMEKHNSQESLSPIKPEDVLVMAPNIGDYAPFIRSVFGSAENQLDIQIMDLEASSKNKFIQGFLHLLDMPFSRWDNQTVLELLEYPAFQARFRLSKQDIESIYSWIKTAGVLWGHDALHRNELLKRDHCRKEMDEINENGTWEYSLGRLLEGIAMQMPETPVSADSLSFSPLEKVETHQAHLLGTLLHLIRSLQADLKPLSDQTAWPIEDWATYLKCLVDSYFRSSSEAEDADGHKILIEHIDSLYKAGAPLNKAAFTFHSIQKHLKQALQTQTVTHRESSVQAVRFCSLLPMRAIPAKVIVLMGMGDGLFPRPEKIDSLNRLPHVPKGDYYPGQVDFDRYLFLEALLSARDYFVMTYVSQAPGDSQELLPSLVIKEIMSYVDQAYGVPEGPLSALCHYWHLLFPFHKSYYTAESPFKSYSKAHYLSALAHYQIEKKQSPSFLSSFVAKEGELKSEIKTIELTDLIAFARNPLKLFFNKSLGIYIASEESRRLSNEEDFLLSPLYKSSLLKESIRSPANVILERAKKDPRFPMGPFQSMEAQKFLSEAAILKENLKRCHIQPESIVSLEFSERHPTVSLSNSSWKIPPLLIDMPSGRLQIVGKLDFVSPEGLIVFAENTLEEAVKAWPALLVFCCLVKVHQLPASLRSVFAKDEKKLTQEINFENPENRLQDYLKYYFHGLNNPSPLIPEWISFFLNGNLNKLHQAFQNGEEEYRKIFNQYLEWLKKNSPNIDFDSSLPHWQPTAQSLFVDMNSAWYPKLCRSPK